MANVPEKTMMNWTSLQNTISGTKKRAMRALMAEYTSLLKEPAEGFIVVKVDDPFNWDVGIYGPPSTPYWGGYFKVHVSFPDEYPFEPPKLKFKSRFWHPNVYHNGSVCISILHDPQAEDIPTDLPREEKWNPTLSVRTVLLSLISIMGSPNPDSPANPEASKMYRSWLEEGDQDYVKVIEDIVKRSKKTALRDGVSVPKTLEEYLTKPRPKVNEPLVNYSSDEDSSDQSELLSLPSSQESDHEDFFDAESSWINANHDVITVEPPNLATFNEEESVPSLSNHHRNNLEKGISNQILQDYYPISSQNIRDTNESQPHELNRAVEANISSLLGMGFDPILSRGIEETSLSLENEQTSSLGINHEALSFDVATSSSESNDRTSSNINANKISLSRGVDQTSLSIEASQTSLLRTEYEQTPSTCRSQTSSLEGTDNATLSLDIDGSFLPRGIVQTTSSRYIDQSSSSSTNDEYTTQAARTAIVSLSRPPNSNRKRRRPPRLYLFSQINDIKKRKRQ